MSDEPSKSMAVFCIALFVLFGALISAFSIWLRVSSAPDVDGLSALENHDPYADPNPAPPVPENEAAKIGIEEVKRREGWSGIADRPVDREGFWWYVAVWRKPKPHPSSLESRRIVVVDGADGKVLIYNRNPRP
jgi:hypothetical protein